LKSVNFRPYQSAQDLEGMAQVHQDSANADYIDADSTLESIPAARDLENRLHDNHRVPATDILIAEADGRIVGYTQTGWWGLTDGTRLHIIHAHLLPAFRNKGIGTAQLEWAEKRSREISRELPPAKGVFFGSNASSAQLDRTKLLEDHGYQWIFSLVEMVNNDLRDVADSGLPQGFELKRMEQAHIRSIWEANNSAYKGRDFISEPTEEEYAGFVSDAGRDFDLWQVAWHGHSIAGFVLSKIVNGRAEVTQVSVLQDFRRKGLGEALMRKNIRALKKKGINRARLCTSGENVAGAQNLYKNVGFETVKKFNRYRKPLPGGSI
jgi:ribosomal-protein-alanine N-acetyltransferase